MTLLRLIISTALAVMSLFSAAHSQEVLYLDRSSFGKAVLSQTESTVGDIQLELSVGDYKNEPIINYSDRSELVQFGRSVGRLDVLYDKGISSCTAFIVSKQYILTNYHCSLGILENARINASRIDAINFVAGYTQTGIEENTRKYTVIPTPVESSKELDYAVLEVVGDPSQEYGELKLASLAPQSGDPFWIIGHPMGEGQRVSREKCRASSPAVSAGKLLHTCDTLPGNSGSPVIDVNLRQVVALHHAGSQKDSVNFAILMSEILENSTVLAAYKAPEDVPKSQPMEPRTATNSACDVLYSAALEAKACYAYDVYIKNCAAHALAPMARGYIDEFCQPENVVKLDKMPTKTCDDDPSLCNTDQLCGRSLTFKSGKAAWRLDGVRYVDEAKRRGLNCGVARVEALPKKICREDLSSCLEAELCDMSSVFSQNGKVWTRYSPNQKYVIEAKRRGLSCDVLEAVLKPKKTCREDLSSCLEAELCNLSSVFSQSGKVWTKYAPNQKYVQEAKRRKLTCGVTEAVAKSANKTEVVFSKADFAKLGRTQRKQLQYGLKQLGYYSSSIDGLWGKGTNAGVNSFAKDRSLISNFPKSVFDALALEVAFENMPVSEKTGVNKNNLGIRTLPDGSKYVGETKDGKKHGKGFLFLADGRVNFCIYRAAQFITQSRKPENNGVISYDDYQVVIARRGETVADIANRLGLDPITLARNNGITAKDRLRSGNVLVLPKDVWIDEQTPNNQNSNCIGTNAYDVAIILRKQFLALSAYKREKIQSDLKRRNLYTSSIDGKWGRSTLHGTN